MSSGLSRGPHWLYRRYQTRHSLGQQPDTDWAGFEDHPAPNPVQAILQEIPEDFPIINELHRAFFSDTSGLDEACLFYALSYTTSH